MLKFQLIQNRSFADFESGEQI